MLKTEVASVPRFERENGTGQHEEDAMRKMRLVLLAMLLAVPFAATAKAQVAVGIGVGPAVVPVPEVYGPPVCDWGYYPYYPYACAPYGYYGPNWFYGGVFIGAGPWFNRGWYGRGGYGYGLRGGYGYRGGYGGGPRVGALRSYGSSGMARGYAAPRAGGTSVGRATGGYGGGGRAGGFGGGHAGGFGGGHGGGGHR